MCRNELMGNIVMRSLVITVTAFLAACGSGSGSGSESVSNSPTQTVSFITLTPSVVSIQVSQTQPFVATATDASGTPISGLTFTWTTSPPMVASIDNAGLVTGLALGTATIMATDGLVTSNQATLIVTTPSAGPRVYTTNFAKTENPISEDGKWLNGGTNGTNWSDIQTTGGFAYGTQTGIASPPYNDSIAVLTGPWGANQSGEGIVKTINQQSSALGVYEEVEIFLRGAITAGNLRGYECNFHATTNAVQAYAQIVRWNGGLGQFMDISRPTGVSPVLRNGDTVKCVVTDSNPVVITSYINGVVVTTASDNSDSQWTSGSPGFGLFLQGETGLNTDFGFTSYTASDGP